jgi:RNA polymerase sigma-70 factor (ECF subfamily)
MPNALTRADAAVSAHVPTFSDLYVEHFPFVLRNVRRLLGGGSSVDDVVQEVFYVALRRLPEFEGRASFRTWLYAILRRVVSGYRRTERRGGVRDSSVDLAAIAARESGPHKKAEKREAEQILQLVLDQLDDERREVFVMAVLEQMTAPQIVEVIGTNVTTVHARLRDARRQFKALAHRYYGGDAHGDDSTDRGEEGRQP